MIQSAPTHTMEKPKFTSAKIKKLMQADNDVGRVAAPALTLAGDNAIACRLAAIIQHMEMYSPCMLTSCSLPHACTGKSVELFASELITKAAAVMAKDDKSSKTLTIQHMCARARPPPKMYRRSPAAPLPL